jgi:hypothetical protein
MKRPFIEMLCALIIGLAIGSLLVGCKSSKAVKVTKGERSEKSLVHITDQRKIDFKTDVHVQVPDLHIVQRKCKCCSGYPCRCQPGNCRCKCAVKVP